VIEFAGEVVVMAAFHHSVV